MKILLLGSGGREHALAWKIAQSDKVEKLFIAPGNAGTSNVGENVNIKADDVVILIAEAHGREGIVKTQNQRALLHDLRHGAIALGEGKAAQYQHAYHRKRHQFFHHHHTPLQHSRKHFSVLMH